MPKKPGKTAKRARQRKKAAPKRSPPRTLKGRTEEEIAALAAPAHAQRFVEDLLSRDEAGALNDGKLPLGKTHIIETKKGEAPKITRARFSVTG